MGIEADVSALAFDVFADDATLEGVGVRVIVDKDIEVMDDDGGSKRVAYLVQGLKSAFTWSRNDSVIHSGTTYRLLDLIADDGFIVKVAAAKIA